MEDISISESLGFSMEHFTNLPDGVTITEDVQILIIRGSGIVNGATINGAII